MNTYETLLKRIDLASMRRWRHSIHRQPELGFEEFHTSALVAKCLTQWGYEVTTGLAGTGLVGKMVFGTGSRRLGLRAEMDALPIQEATGLPWASEVPGVFHGCGHDGHTTMLLGAAQAIAALRDEAHDLDGTLHLIFQPAEELGGAGGAQRMIDEGLFERFPCEAIFAMHNLPGLPAGHLYFRDGPFMASSDRVVIRFQGRGGHGAMPHLAADPTVAACATVMALQTIVARDVDPVAAAVISVGRLQAGQTYNVIPDTAELELSVRALAPEIRDLLERRIHEVVNGQALSFGLTCTIDYERGYPVLVNAPEQTRFAFCVAKAVFGAVQSTDRATPLCASEDFAYMLAKTPGSYVLIGNGDNGFADGEPRGACSVHNPHFDFNDDNLGRGAAFWLALTQAYFSKSSLFHSNRS